MKAYVLDQVNDLNYRDYELRELKDGEALVEVYAAGICGSDIPRIFVTGTYHFPTIPGHEFAGRVVQARGDESWIGKRVGVFPLIPCNNCVPCENENYEMCEHYSYLGSRTDGGFAEYVIVPTWNLIELPESISFDEAAMMEPAAVACHAVRRAGLDLEDKAANGNRKVLIMGLGTIGGIIAQWLSIAGVRDVTATGHHVEQGDLMWLTADEQYKFVKTAGFVSALDAAKDLANGGTCLLEENSFDLVIDCVDTEASVMDALRLVKPAGKIVEVGNPKTDITIDKDIYWKLLRKQIQMTGSWNSSFTHSREDDWHTVLSALECGSLHLNPLITHRLPFDALPKGLEIMYHRAEFCNKVVIKK